MTCIFCELDKVDNHVFDTDHFYGVWDINPIQEGHLLIIAKRHRMNISELTRDELAELGTLTQTLIGIFEKQSEIFGVTSIVNNGNTMTPGTHFHQHLIPRLEGDGFYDTLDVAKKDVDLDLLQRAFESFKLES